MNGNWLTNRLGEVCELYQPKTISTSEMVKDGKYLVYGANGVIGKYNRYNHEESQLLITCRGATCGAINISEPKSWINGNAMVVRPKDQSLNVRFLEYLFRGGIDISNCITGAAQPQITRLTLSPVEIRYPQSLPEQRRIVSILDEVLAAIAKAKANAERNLQNVNELFESYLQGVFENPEKPWDETSLGEICDLFVDSAHRTPKYQQEGIPALRPRDVVNGQLNLANSAKVSQSEYEIQSKRHKPCRGDIVYSRELSYGWAAILPESPLVCLSQGMCLFRPSKSIDSSFLLYILNGPIGREQAEQVAVGAAHPHINLGDIRAYRIPISSIAAQREVVNALDSLSEKTKRLECIYNQRLTDLEDLKKSILHKAFNGELKSIVKELA